MRQITYFFLLILLIGCDEDSSIKDCDPQINTCVVNVDFSSTYHKIELDTFGYLTSEDYSNTIFEQAQLPGVFSDNKGLLFQNNVQGSYIFAYISRKVTGLKPGGLYDINYNIRFVTQSVADCYALEVSYPLSFNGIASGSSIETMETKDSPSHFSGISHYWAFSDNKALNDDDFAYISRAALPMKCSDDSNNGEWRERIIDYKETNYQREYTAVANEKGELWVALIIKSYLGFGTVYLEDTSFIFNEM
jgi:hypothetical protein